MYVSCDIVFNGIHATRVQAGTEGSQVRRRGAKAAQDARLPISDHEESHIGRRRATHVAYRSGSAIVAPYVHSGELQTGACDLTK